ncbi:unnamed protein product [[Candida] boidinii]|uniref:Unnamed protein product n=1 Tax=Candida boidinii TaxID=5477 RepID=A0ACB5U7J4_CANBO|nr:unnamed protein product [[Candida] boidinii]
MTSDFFEFEGEDEEDDPPPSYAELEQSGSLTYSGSIYRTGFEKAGFQMNHVNVPLPELNLSNYQNENIISRKNNLKLKRKLPPPISEEGSSSVNANSTNDANDTDTTPSSTNDVNNKNKGKSEADPNSINFSTPKNSKSKFNSN